MCRHKKCRNISGKISSNVLEFSHCRRGKYHGAFSLAQNDDLASKHELAHGVNGQKKQFNRHCRSLNNVNENEFMTKENCMGRGLCGTFDIG